MPLWTPAQLTTARWFDFSNASSVTEVSGTVSQINDLSGNSGHLSQGTAGSRPTYTIAQQNGLNVATFDGAANFLSLASDFSLGTAHAIFLIGKPSATITAATSHQCVLSGGSYTHPSTTTSEFIFSLGSVTGNLTNERLSSLVIAHDVLGANVYGRGKTDANISGGFFASTAYTTASNQFRGRFNGADDLATASSVGSFVSTNTRYPTFLRHLGSRGGASNFFSGEVWEVAVFTSYLSQTDTELIEGYLAWKWGVQASLPGGHPYASAAPRIPGGARRKIGDGLLNNGLINRGLAR
jgi:hypothetical protein